MTDKLYTDLQIVDQGEGWEYRVDAVRESLDAHGLKRQQRLTAARYPSQGEAEEHQAELDAALDGTGWADLSERLREQPYEHTHYQLAVNPPPELWSEPDEATRLVLMAYSGDHIAQTAVAEGERRMMARYAASLEDMQALQGDEVLLEASRQLAVGQGLIEPGAPLFSDNIAPERTPDPQPEYYFGYGMSDANRPALEAVKTWTDGAERHFDTLTISEYDRYEDAVLDEYILETMLATDGVEKAMNIAERWAVANGHLDPQRDDPRIFFEDDTPPDPFTTNREREMPDYGFGAISANGEHFVDVVKSWGATGLHGEYERLTIPQPTWEDAQLAAEMAFTDQQNGDLQVAIRRIEALAEDAGVLDPERADGRLFTQGPPDPFETLREQDLRENPFLYGAWPPELEDDLTDDVKPFTDRFDPMSPDEADPHILRPLDDTVKYGVQVMDVDPDTIELSIEKYWNEPNGFLGVQSVTVGTYDSQSEHGREQALVDQSFLLEFHADNGLQAMMHRAENMAAVNGHLNPYRADPRLFTEGPPDRFETLAQRLAGEMNPFWNTDDTTELGAAENPYWRFDTLPVEDADGEALGVALHVVRYPTVESSPGVIGAPAIPDNARFELLEVAHFETMDAADRFADDFVGYLKPGVLNGPELAEEVARREGHPADWRELNDVELAAYEDLTLTLTRSKDEWKVYGGRADMDEIDADTEPDFAVPDWDL